MASLTVMSVMLKRLRLREARPLHLQIHQIQWRAKA